MNIYELVDEIERVRNLLKLENEYRTYKKFRS